MKRLCLAALALGVAWPALAQTVIVPDTAAAATTGTTAVPVGTTTVIDGGTRVGNNLFHSFTSFSLATGDLALWTRAASDGASIAHIVNRVTGGTVSTIDGTLATQDMPNASFWFINPAGIVFGANASVAVPNAAHFSTAGVLRFADGGTFAVTTPGGSVLSVAAPSAFGFLGAQGGISVTGAQPGFVGADTHLGLSAANLAITDSTFTAGSLDFAAVGTGIGNLTFADLDIARFGTGRIALTDSSVTAEPGPLGTGAVRAMAARLDVTGSIFSSDSNDIAGAGLRLNVGDLRISASPNSQFAAYLGSFARGAGDAGALAIQADSVLASGTSLISTQALETATGNAGTIRILTGALTLENGASILSSAYGNSATGEIDISAGRIMVRSGGSIESTTYGAGRGGDLGLQAASLLVDGGRIASEAEVGSSGQAGTVNIGVPTGAVLLTNGGVITSSSAGAGFAGFVGVVGDTITLQGGSSIQSDSFGPDGAGAGEVQLNARILSIESGSEVSTATEGDGFGGLLLVNANRIVIDSAAINSSSLGGEGTAGIIVVQTDDLSITNNGEITSSTTGAGNAGLVSILTQRLALASGGQISTETFAGGRAGDIEIEATDLALTTGGRIISAQTGAAARGDAGRITITTGTLNIAPAMATAISTSVANSGQAGEIDITARSIILDGAEIGSAANGTAAGRSGFVDIRTDRFDIVNGGRVETSSFSPEVGGGIAIEAGTLRLQGTGSEITSENLSTRGGAAGSVFVAANSLQLLDGAGISTDSATGAAGDITIVMPETSSLILRARNGAPAFITTSSGPGTGGVITIASPYLILSDGGAILALGEAFGADVLIQSNFYIRSADRVNRLSVDGGLIVDSEVGDLSTGSESIDLSFLDASSVLRGQCAAARTGGVSQLNTRITGPYVPFARSVPPGAAISFNSRPAARCG